MITTEHENSVEKLLHRVEDYCTTSFELFKLKSVRKVAGVIATVAAQLVTLIIATLAVLIVSIGVALWVGETLGKLYYGFFAVGGFYVLAAILFFSFGEASVKTPLANALNEHLLDDENG